MWPGVKPAQGRQMDQAQPNTGTAAQRNRDTHTHMGPEAKQQNRCPRCSPTVPGERASLTMEPHGLQARQMEIHVGEAGTEPVAQTHTGRLKPEEHKDRDTQHAQQRHKESRKYKSDLATFLPQFPF